MIYRLHGLTFSSEIELPHWPAGTGECDASIRWGEVPAALPDSHKVGTVFTGRTGIGLLNYVQVGPILVASGSEIIVSRSAAPDWVRPVLSGTAVALLLHQRSRLCLHASSVVQDGRAYLIAGSSGAGKSTTAAALVERGATLLADDITAVDIAPNGTLVAYPGLQTLRLNTESVAALPLHSRQPSHRSHHDDKHLIAASGNMSDIAVPIASIAFLRAAGDAPPTSKLVVGSAGFAAIEKNIFRPRMAKIVSDPRWRFTICTQLANRVPLYELVRPEKAFHLDSLCARVLASVAN